MSMAPSNAATAAAIEFDAALLGPALSEATGSDALSLQLLGGGRNSRVYRVCSRVDSTVQGALNESVYAAKFYCNQDPVTPAPGADSNAVSLTRTISESEGARDRRGSEFAALRFLWKNGVRCVPEPIATFPERSLSILRLVEGTPLTAADVTRRDVESLVGFLVRLDALKTCPASPALPDASEACYSLAALAESIRVRLAPLQTSATLGDSLASEKLRLFLDGRLRPALERALESATAIMNERGLEIDSVIPLERRTLSPSDFGFHNALRRPDRSLVFMDFEHFGWDDPAKMVADFLLHPALPLSNSLRRHFMRQAITLHPACRGLGWRVGLVFPLYAIKWCTILLNEFVPEHRRRRNFANGRTRDLEAVLLRQLAKAESLLTSASNYHGEFSSAE